MSKLKYWILKKIIRSEIIQGECHDKKITGLYQMIRDAAEEEFTEDNIPTMNSFLQECFDKTQK